MSHQPYALPLLWEATNHGLDYFHELFPQSVGLENKNKHFKTHHEQTPSSTLSNKKTKDGVYLLYNHATKAYFNMIDHCKVAHGYTFLEACGYLFQKYGLVKATSPDFKPATSFEKTTHEIGFYKIDYAKKVDDYQFFAPFLTPALCKAYDFYLVAHYQKAFLNSKTGVPTLLTVTANANYPIFAYKGKEFAKIYEPKASKDDKYNLKHHFLGVKPAKQIYGWDRLFDKVDIAEIDQLYDKLRKAKGIKNYVAGENWSIEDVTDKATKDIITQLHQLKLESVIIATGGSDGLNLASLGYDVIWFNSEAEIISSADYYQLSKIAKTIYYLPDLDKTGVKQAVAMGLQYVKIKIIWLPHWLLQEKKKDLRDWVHRYKSEPIEKVKARFKKLYAQALEFQFWEWQENRTSYGLNNKIMLYFLKHNGFYLNKVVLKTADSQSEIEKTRLVHIKNNIIRTVSPRQVKNYVLQWLDNNYINIKIYNMILKSVYFSENALLSLPEIQIDTKMANDNSQLYFFDNKVVKITSEKIQALTYDEVDHLVWHSDIIPHRFELQDSHFTISQDENQHWRINLLNDASNYLKVLINTSRMYWEKDADGLGNDTQKFNINSNNLSEEENQTQELQLINKIYVVGYLLHKYKVKQKAFFTLGVDHKNGLSIKESNGRSGKSFIQESLKCFLKNWKDKNGKLMPKENPQFIYDKVTGNTDYIFFDDLTENQDYNFFFAITTGSLEANHKGGEIYDIPFDDAPKLGATTNFAPSNLSASLQGRLLVYYVSDYYHQKTSDNGYAFTRQISDDFNNRTLLDKHYPEQEWQNDYNFMLQCLQFYLQQPQKIDAPMDTLIIKNLRQLIGDDTLKLFEDFLYDGTKLNVWFNKHEIQNLYKEDVGGKKSPQRQKEDLQRYCKTKNWRMDIKKLAYQNPLTGARNSVEHYFINTASGEEQVANQLPLEPLETAQHMDKQDYIPIDITDLDF
jgi:hypothetical protein